MLRSHDKDALVTDHAAAVNTALASMLPVVDGMGVRATSVRPGYAASTVTLAGNSNHFGAMYAGVLFTVAEVLGGALAVASFDLTTHYPLVKDLRIAFLKPARSDVTAVATLSADDIARVAAQAADTGRAEFVVAAEITADDGTLVATTHGIYQLRAW